MFATCIDNRSCCPGEHEDLPFTVGKQYEVLAVLGTERQQSIITIIDDLGQRVRTMGRRFEWKPDLDWAPVSQSPDGKLFEDLKRSVDQLTASALGIPTRIA